jgi:signal transduction histidine kinase
MGMESVSDLRPGGAIGRRVLLLGALTILVAVVAAGVVLTLLFERNLLRRVGIELEQRWVELASQFEIDPSGKPSVQAALNDPRYQTPFSGTYWQISLKGEPVLRSRSLWDENIEQLPNSVSNGRTLAEVGGPEASTLYALSDSVILKLAGTEQRFDLLVAVDHAEVEALRQSFVRDTTIVLSVFAVLLLVGAWLTSRFGLMPLRQLRAALGAVREGKQPRLAGSLPEEVYPLAADLNEMLTRHDDLVRKARDRAGALAHGLKTPLTILRNEIESLQGVGDPARAQVMMEQVSAISAHVEREVARSRMHAAGTSIGVSTKVFPVIERLVKLMQRMDTEQSIIWERDIPLEASATMEADDFAEVAGNLLDNARKWARSKVSVTIEQRNGRPNLVIRDDGPGVPEDQQNAILERGVFLGGEGNMSSGLGLTIAADALASYGRSLAIDNAFPGCEVSFPLQ